MPSSSGIAAIVRTADRTFSALFSNTRTAKSMSRVGRPVRLANDASNRMYANPTFGSIAGRGIQTGLQVTRVVDAVASAVFGNLWPAIGLPTATDVQALRADVKALREELRTVRAETADEAIGDERQDSTFAPPHRGDSESAAAAIIWNGYKPAPKRAAKGSKKSVAL